MSSINSRLLFWQEQHWEAFRREHNIEEQSFDEIRSLFRYCHVHDSELLEDVVPIHYGTTYAPSEREVSHMHATYPYANTFVSGPCWVEEARESKVFYCPNCRVALAGEHAKRV